MRLADLLCEHVTALHAFDEAATLAVGPARLSEAVPLGCAGSLAVEARALFAAETGLACLEPPLVARPVAVLLLEAGRAGHPGLAGACTRLAVPKV